MRNYLILAVKILARRKFFTFISLFGISMTLVVLMVATAILDNLFAPRAPETRVDRALFIYTVGRYGPAMSQTSRPGYGFLEKWVLTLPDIERASIFSSAQTTAVYQDSKRIETMIKHTDGEYWKILDFELLEGRPITADDDAQRAFVAVISKSLRARLFGSAKGEGRTINVDGQSFRVVGVVPRVPSSRVVAYSDIWVPLSTLAAANYKSQFLGDYSGMVLAKSRDDFPRLKREFQTRMETMPMDDPQFTEVRAGLDTPFEAIARMTVDNRNKNSTGVFRAVFLIGAIAFMALPALNLITINLSRILERSSEIGVRKAFGAPRSSLIFQFVVENVVLTLLGGLIGFAIATAAIGTLNVTGLIPDARFDLNLRIFGYGMLLAAFFGVFSGVYPAWRMSRLNPVDALRGGAL